MKLSWLPLRSFCKYFNFLFVGIERKLVEKYSATEPLYQPVFIIGAPRSGSTVFYQALTNSLNVTYVSNLVELCRELPMIGFSLHDRIFDSRPHNSFTSRYGNTSRLYEPAEGILWRKWLIPGRHYISPEEISNDKKQAFKRTAWAILNRYSRPWVIKNLSFGMRLQLIKEIFPQAYVIYIKRETFYNVQSIYLAYRKLGVKQGELWSIRPPNYKEIADLPLEERVVAQIFYLEKEIEKHLGLFGERSITVQFEDFVNRPEFYVKNIGEQISAHTRLQAAEIKVFNSNKIKITSHEEQLIRSFIRKYYG